MINISPDHGVVTHTHGRDDLKLDIVYRNVRETVPTAGNTIVVNRFINVMLDKRAPGLWCAAIGGPKSRAEYLAEVVVANDLTEQLASIMVQADLLRTINEYIIRSNQRFKRDVLVIDYVTLFRAVSRALNSAQVTADARRVLARIICELLTRAYTKLNVMVPFVGSLELSYETQIVATTSTLIRAARIANVAEVLEAIDLGSAFADAKEFNPAVAEALLGPLFAAAANRLLNTVRYNNYMSDTATLVARYLVHADNLPDRLRDNADIALLATNYSFVCGALTSVSKPIHTPDFELREAIEYTVAKLHEMRRFELISLERFKSMYSYELTRAPSGALAGVVVARNMVYTQACQVTKLVPREEYTIQMQMQVGEAYLSPLIDALVKALGPDRMTRTVQVAASAMITSDYELDDEARARIYLHGVTEFELEIIGLASTDRVYLTDLPDSPALLYDVSDVKAFYNGRGIYSGATVMTADPGELLLLKNEDFAGSTPFISRPQTILEDMRTCVLAEPPEAHMISLMKSVRLALPEMDGKEMALLISLQELLGLEGVGELLLTRDPQAAREVNAAFGALVLCYTMLTKNNTDIARHLARQVAVATHALIGTLASTEVFRRLLDTLFVRYIQDGVSRGDRHRIRQHLTASVVQHQLILNVAMLLLLKTGVLDYGLHHDVTAMFESERVVELAVTAATWQSALRPTM